MRRSTVHLVLVAAVTALALTGGACASKGKPATAPAAATAGTPAPAPATPAPTPPAAAAGPTSSGAPAATRPALGPPPLTGLVTRAAIESFNDVWKGLRAQDYEPDATVVSAIRDHAAGVDVFAVVATWCPDTRRDLPRFFKIADQAGLPMTRVQMLAVDRTKKDGGGLTEKWTVTRVPTFIFLRGGKEIGRVTEKPLTTLEKDIAEIVARR